MYIKILCSVMVLEFSVSQDKSTNLVHDFPENVWTSMFIIKVNVIHPGKERKKQDFHI